MFSDFLILVYSSILQTILKDQTKALKKSLTLQNCQKGYTKASKSGIFGKKQVFRLKSIVKSKLFDLESFLGLKMLDMVRNS